MTERRRVLVTGGSKGLGAAMVTELHGRGAAVAFTYRADAEAAERVSRNTGEAAAGFKHDMVVDDPTVLLDSVVATLGGLDGVILNAGMWAGGRIETVPPEVWWKVIETNVRGTADLARAAVPHLKGGRGASMLFISSAVALSGFPGDTAYASSKAALIGFARSLAHELAGAGVRVNVLAPGFVETEMTAAINGPARQRIEDRVLLGRFGNAGEIAKAAAFLSEDATYCTGAVLTVDGGWTL